MFFKRTTLVAVGDEKYCASFMLYLIANSFREKCRRCGEEAPDLTEVDLKGCSKNPSDATEISFIESDPMSVVEASGEEFMEIWEILKKRYAKLCQRCQYEKLSKN